MRIPAAGPAVALAAGVAAGTSLPLQTPAVGALFMLAAVAGAVTAWWRHAARVFLACVLIGFAAAGATLGAVASARAHHSILRAHHDGRLRDGLGGTPFVIEGRLAEDAARTAYGASLLLLVDRVESDGSWSRVDGGVRLSVGGSLAAGALPGWRAGRRVRVTATLRTPSGFRNPGARDEVTALAQRGVALVGSVKSGALVEVVARGHAPAEAAAALRARVRSAVDRRLGARSGQSAAIVTAILIGDRAGLDPDVERRLQEAGTYHVIAISGGNIAVLAGVALALLRLTRAPGRLSAGVTIVALGAYGYAAGGWPSVNRATLAAMLHLAARALDHRAPAMNTLAVVLAVAVVRQPLDLFDAGLALSYAATLALLIAAEKNVGYLFRGRRSGNSTRHMFLRGVIGLGVATMCAELAVLPISALAFGRVTAAGLLLNFAAVPLMALAQIAGLVVVAFDAGAPLLAAVAARVADAAVSAVVSSTVLLDAAPWLTWRVPVPPAALLVVYYGAWVLAIAAARWRRTALLIACAAGLVIASPAGVVRARPAPGSPTRTLTRWGGLPDARAALRVTVLDVGQGDAALIELPSGRRLLVDTGGAPGSTFDVGARVVAPALVALGVRRLHALALTHPDPDHIGGAPAVLREFRPTEIWEGIPVPPHPARRAVAAQAARLGAGWRLLRAGARLRDGAVEIDVLHPPPPEWERQRARNDDSIVLDVRLGGVAILLPGDIGREVERAIAPSLRPAALRILKAAHHGSATSTSTELLRAAAPAAVIFSAGRDNRFGHPAPAVLARVRATGAEIFRTDQGGAITVETDGQRVELRTVSRRSWTTSVKAPGTRH